MAGSAGRFAGKTR